MPKLTLYDFENYSPQLKENASLAKKFHEKIFQ